MTVLTPTPARTDTRVASVPTSRTWALPGVVAGVALTVALAGPALGQTSIARRVLLASGGEPALDRLLAMLGPVSLAALLTTLVLLFGLFRTRARRSTKSDEEAS